MGIHRTRRFVRDSIAYMAGIARTGIISPSTTYMRRLPDYVFTARVAICFTRVLATLGYCIVKIAAVGNALARWHGQEKTSATENYKSSSDSITNVGQV